MSGGHVGVSSSLTISTVKQMPWGLHWKTSPQICCFTLTGVSIVGNAPGLGPGDRRFESGIPDCLCSSKMEEQPKTERSPPKKRSATPATKVGDSRRKSKAEMGEG